MRWGFLLIFGLILFDLAVHPLTAGPDRLIHDPVIYRLWDPGYMAGDWYTSMAVASGVYPFFATLVNAWHWLHIPEEFWRLVLFLLCLAVLYGSLIHIARKFTKNWLVVPIIAVLHWLIATGVNQPVWLYGPFIQVDGGLAPRSIGIALSFLALALLVDDLIIWASIVLGIATLFHVSNSLIVYTLFFGAWLILKLITQQTHWRKTLLEAGKALAAYLVSGGWFAASVALQTTGAGGGATLSTSQFIWTWTYFRASYMALPLAGVYWWLRLGAHAGAITGGWIALHFLAPKQRQALSLVALVGLGALAYFFLFYLFAFIHPWLPGFQFYSLRVIYLAYFVAYLFLALGMVLGGQWLLTESARRLTVWQRQLIGRILLAVLCFAFLTTLSRFDTNPSLHRFAENLQRSAWRIMDTSVILSGYVPDNKKIRPPHFATFDMLRSRQEPFLAPPNWQTYGVYLPNVASFKSFGFTQSGLPDWYARMNDVSLGAIEELYQAQRQTGEYRGVELNWSELYQRLTSEDVLRLAERYHFSLFVAGRTTLYPFPILTEDHDYRLYELPTR